MTPLAPAARRLRRPLALSAAGLVAALSLTACGGADAAGAPEDASTEEFCEVFNDSELQDAEGSDEQADAAQNAAEQFAEVGTPEGISEEERNGFELFVDFLSDVNADDIDGFEEAESEDDVQEALGLDEEEGADVIAFVTYAATTCAEA